MDLQRNLQDPVVDIGERTNRRSDMIDPEQLALTRRRDPETQLLDELAKLVAQGPQIRMGAAVDREGPHQIRVASDRVAIEGIRQADVPVLRPQDVLTHDDLLILGSMEVLGNFRRRDDVLQADEAHGRLAALLADLAVMRHPAIAAVSSGRLAIDRRKVLHEVSDALLGHHKSLAFQDLYRLANGPVSTTVQLGQRLDRGDRLVGHELACTDAFMEVVGDLHVDVTTTERIDWHAPENTRQINYLTRSGTGATVLALMQTGKRTAVILQKTYQEGQIYRNGKLVCSRARVTIGDHYRSLGLAARERCFVTVAFREGTEVHLRGELSKLIKQRGAAAKRTAERLEPIVVVVQDNELGERRIEGVVRPLTTRPVGDLANIDFPVRQRDGALPVAMPITDPDVNSARVARLARQRSEPSAFVRAW